jgi:hypothetical protein
MKRRHNADPWAGGNHAAGTHHGKHGKSPGWKPGRHWVVCQRCGLDYYDSDIKAEWTGAIVCKSCWEPRHPQDFTRSYPEKIAPPSGLVTGGGLGVGGPPADGGTACLPSTFITGEVSETTDLVDRLDGTDDTITAIETSGCFMTWEDPLCGTVAPINYTLLNAPDGISIDAATGIITGTVSETADTESPYSSTVRAQYITARVEDCPFTWTVFLSIVPPDSFDYIPCDPPRENLNNLQGWYDCNDLTSMYIGNTWSGDNVTAGDGSESAQSQINKAYPLADFPSRGTTETADLIYEHVDQSAVIIAHDLAPSQTSPGLDAVAEYCWAGKGQGFEGNPAAMRTHPRQTGQPVLGACNDRATRFWAFEIPSLNELNDMVLVTNQTTSAWSRIHANNNATPPVIEYWNFEAGSHHNRSDILEITEATPTWVIIGARNNEDSSVRETNFWVDGTHAVTHNPAERGGFQSSLMFMKQYPTPFQGLVWTNKLGEWLTYDRWLTNSEMDDVFKYLGNQHGVTISGNVTCQGQEAANGCT